MKLKNMIQSALVATVFSCGMAQANDPVAEASEDLPPALTSGQLQMEVDQ